MIIDRYVRREIARPLLPIVGVLVAVFAGYSTAALLADAVGGLLPPAAIARLVGLKVLISLEVLLPVALYVSVILGLGRLTGDLELVAAHALRMTPGRVTAAVVSLSLSLAVAVGLLSNVARPWAYRALHRATAHAGTTLDAGAMRPGTFYVGQDGKRMIFFSRQERSGSAAGNVLVQIWKGPTRMEIIRAGSADIVPASPPETGSRIDLHHVRLYALDLAGDGGDDRLVEAEDMIVDPNDETGGSTPYSAVAASTRHLLGSSEAADVAELQWRFSTPLSTLLLGLLAIPISRAGRRQGRGVRLAVAILIYFAYDMLFTSARTWVQHGAISPFPGIWWVPAVLAAGLAASLLGPWRHELENGRA